MKGFKNIPAGWVVMKGEDISTKITKGSSPKWQGFDYQDHGTLFVTSENVRDGFLDVSNPKFLPEEFNEKMSNSQLRTNDILINIVGASIGRNCVYNLNGDVKANINQAVCLLRPNNKHLSSYICFFLQIPSSVRKLLGTQSDSARPNLTLKDIRDFRFLLPSLPEQKAIAALLSTWDEAIEKTERLIQAKEACLNGQIQRMISQRCDSWPHIKPKKIFDTITEKNFPEEELLSVTQDRGVIPRRMLEGRVMSPDGTTASYKLIKQGDFAISLRSFQGGIEYSNYQGIISPAYTVLRPKIELNSDFYRLFFKSYIFIEKYLNLAVIGIRDGKQISIPDFLSIKIPVPPLEEQKEIAETLSVCKHEIDLLKQLADKYKTQKRGLMQKMLTGEWRMRGFASYDEV